jgi:L-asparaginase
MPRIAVLFTGGTISMRGSGRSGNRPSLTGHDLLEVVPELRDTAKLEVVDWGLVPGSHLTFDDVLSIGHVVRNQLSRTEVDGVVIVQGTDNIEETAFAWDLLPLPAKPLVVVGAMRSASQHGYDGPDNLRNAVAAAASRELAGFGVVVAMGGELHAADAVRKTHTHAYETFKSPGAGRIGLVAEGEVHVERSRRPFHLQSIPERAGRVSLITSLLDGDPLMTAALLDHPPDGLVVEAMGSGNTQAELLEQVQQLMDRGVHVVLTTRCLSGRVRPGYGFAGGSTTWWDAGAVFSGTLGGLKSRVALSLGTGAGLRRDEVVDLFAWFGGGVKT